MYQHLSNFLDFRTVHELKSLIYSLMLKQYDSPRMHGTSIYSAEGLILGILNAKPWKMA